MILIADSGSTKTNWLALTDEGEALFEIRSEGLNPTVFSKKILKQRLISESKLYGNRQAVKNIFFYGSGCGSQAGINCLKQVFNEVFEHANLEIYDDMVGALNSLQLKTPGIVCILGTGSNCCLYDGKVAHQKIVSLGYLIMDDASGSYFGRELIRDYYHLKMPSEIAKKFELEYDLKSDSIKEGLYNNDNPNTYLANFAGFLINNKNTSYAQSMIFKGLRLFIENQILIYKESDTFPIYFIGSIAYYLQQEIENILEEYQLKFGKIVRHPIENLAKYHLLKK